jgi:hypothetical protein
LVFSLAIQWPKSGPPISGVRHRYLLPSANKDRELARAYACEFSASEEPARLLGALLVSPTLTRPMRTERAELATGGQEYEGEFCEAPQTRRAEEGT